jgi:citrate lyase beta subunit
VPTGAAVAHARAVVQALAEAERAGAGAAQIDGAMIDEPVRLAALRVLARAGEQVAEVTE